MKRPMERSLTVVTGVGDDREALLEERTIDELLRVLFDRADRLVHSRETREALRPALREFVCNVVEYFDDSDALDDYVMTNIMTALLTADAHGPSRAGVEDFSTFIRSLNPTDPEADGWFVIGRAGRLDDPDCPLEEMEKKGDVPSLPAPQLHMFHAFRHARSKDTSRGAPRIPVEPFERLIPKRIAGDPALEQAFLDVCMSDGAWQLYQLKLAA